MQDICYSENHIAGPDKSKIWFDLLWLDQIYFKLHILRQEIFVSCQSLMLAISEADGKKIGRPI